MDSFEDKIETLPMDESEEIMIELFGPGGDSKTGRWKTVIGLLVGWLVVTSVVVFLLKSSKAPESTTKKILIFAGASLIVMALMGLVISI